MATEADFLRAYIEEHADDIYIRSGNRNLTLAELPQREREAETSRFIEALEKEPRCPRCGSLWSRKIFNTDGCPECREALS